MARSLPKRAAMLAKKLIIFNSCLKILNGCIQIIESIKYLPTALDSKDVLKRNILFTILFLHGCQYISANMNLLFLVRK